VLSPLLLPLLWACAHPAPADDTAGSADLGTCDASGGRQDGVITSLAFVRAEGDTSDGFDLDGDVSSAGGSGGCGIPDMVSPEGVPGIDNAFARLLPVLETTEFIAVESLIADAIHSGELLLIPELEGVESLQDDDCVTLVMRRGAGQPMTDTQGELLPDQTLELDPSFGNPTVAALPLVAGRVQGRPFEVELPLQILNADIDMVLLDGAVRFDLAEDRSMRGVFAGRLSTAYLRKVAQTKNVSGEIYDLVNSLVDSVADLAPDGTGQCTQLSVTMEFTAVPAYVFEDQVFEDQVFEDQVFEDQVFEDQISEP